MNAIQHQTRFYSFSLKGFVTGQPFRFLFLFFGGAQQEGPAFTLQCGIFNMRGWTLIKPLKNKDEDEHLFLAQLTTK